MLRAAIVAAVAGLLVAVPGRASLYTPDEPMPFPVNKDGVAEALLFDEFKRRLIVVMNQANPAPPTDGTVNTDRVQLVERVAKRKAIPKPTTLDVLALSADLLRLGDDGRGVSFVDEALNLLKPRDRET